MSDKVKDESKKPNWLDEVKADAERLTLKRIKDNEEERAYKASKEK